MRRSLLTGAALLAGLCVGAPAEAQSDRPVTVEYDAPSECASSWAFRVLLETQIARYPDPGRAWRWAVRIHRQGAVYEGTLTGENGIRTAKACSCDDVTAVLALMIARGDPEAPGTTLECAAPPPPQAVAPPPTEPPPPPAVAPPVVDKAEHPARPEWRASARAEFTNHGTGTSSTVAGGMGVLSLEIPGGFDKLMFEVAAGKLSAQDGGTPLSYSVLDTQTCLLDVSLGTTGLSFLGCVRVAGAAFNAAPYSYGGVQYPQSGGALWGGLGGRVRWQIPFGLFAEASVTGMYGTVSGGESTQPAWYDAALSAGWRF